MGKVKAEARRCNMKFILWLEKTLMSGKQKSVIVA